MEPEKYELGGYRYYGCDDPAIISALRKADALDALDAMWRNGQTVEIMPCPGGRGVILDPSALNSLIPNVTAPDLLTAIESLTPKGEEEKKPAI